MWHNQKENANWLALVIIDLHKYHHISPQCRPALTAERGPEELQHITSERRSSINRAEVQWLTRGIPLVINHRTGQSQTCHSEVDRQGHWTTACPSLYLRLYPLHFSWLLFTRVCSFTVTACSISPLVVSHLHGWNMLCGYGLIDWLAAERGQLFLLLMGPRAAEGTVPI